MFNSIKSIFTPVIEGFGFRLPVWQEMALSCFLAIMAILFMGDIFGTISNAQANLEVYDYEQSIVELRKQEQERLKSELAYYQSLEYARLYARENQNLALPGEQLYVLSDPVKLYQVPIRQRDFYANADYASWWRSLF